MSMLISISISISMLKQDTLALLVRGERSYTSGVAAATMWRFNASLLMEVDPFGRLGSIMQMGLITAVNILVGALAMGFVLRCCNLVSGIQRTAAWLFIIVLVPLIGAFNLLVGHFRDSMQVALGDVVTNPFAMLENDAWPRMIADPLRLGSFQSSLLVILGVLFFGIAAWKGYRSDDSYPGYARRHRQLNAIKEQLPPCLEPGAKRHQRRTRRLYFEA